MDLFEGGLANTFGTIMIWAIWSEIVAEIASKETIFEKNIVNKGFRMIYYSGRL